MGLFDRKYCDICGEKIGLLGNRKLEDGNLCKNCAGKLSPWFSGRRHSAVADIREQLAAREENRVKLEAFHITRQFGDYGRLLLDDDAGTFVVLRSGMRITDNPDLLRLDQVRDCELKISHAKQEEKRKTEDGKQVSYDPPRHKHTYSFSLQLTVEHPYIDQLAFRYHKQDVILLTGMPVQPTDLLVPGPRFTPQEPDIRGSEAYQQTLLLGQEMQQALLGRSEPVEPVVADAEEGQIVCEYCGETVKPDAGCCPCCGAKIS